MNKSIEFEQELVRCRKESVDFIYKLSHDLQAPLRAVIGFSNLVLASTKDRLSDQEKEDMTMVINSAAHAQALINALLQYSRLNMTARPFVLTDVNGIISEVVESMQEEITATGATVAYDPLPTLMADPDQLRVVFRQLIGNAIKFRAKERLPMIHITATLQDNHSMWLFRMTDNGIGIDPKYDDKVFEVFSKLHADSEYPGLGMGLAVTKKIIELHHGVIGIKASLGQGTTVWFTLHAS